MRTVVFFVAIMSWALPPAARADCDVPKLASFGPSWAGLGSLRPALATTGIAIGGSYFAELFGNPTGGFKQGSNYGGVLELHMDADMHKLGFWKGLCFHTNGLQIHDEGITTDNIGGLMPVSSLEATPATRLEDLWLEQHLLNNHLAVRFGQLRAGTDFVISQGGSFFINSTWGWPSIADADLPSGGPAYPLATPGVRVAINPNDKFGLLIGIYNGDPADPNCRGNPQVCNNNGLDFRLDDPPLLMVEGAYRYNKGGLSGTIKLGGWNHFGEFPRISNSRRGPLDNNYSMYAIIDQTVWRAPSHEGARAVTLFGRVMGAPSDRSLVDFYADGGMTFVGMVPRRPSDSFAVGVAYTGINPGSGLSAERTYQAVAEFCYTMQLAPGWTLQPDIQYLWQSGSVPTESENAALKDALVLGVRTNMSF